MLSIEDALALLQSMRERAMADQARCCVYDERGEYYWEGFGDALWTLGRYIETDVKTTCFPVGSCRCHPLLPKGA